MTAYEDIIYEERPKGGARITINRPTSYNAFRGKTVEELIHAFQRAGWDKSIGVIVLTGTGDVASTLAASVRKRTKFPLRSTARGGKSGGGDCCVS